MVEFHLLCKIDENLPDLLLLHQGGVLSNQSTRYIGLHFGMNQIVAGGILWLTTTVAVTRVLVTGMPSDTQKLTVESGRRTKVGCGYERRTSVQ